MGARTGIEWTRGDDGAPGATWNPVTGCDRISPGCEHCYALVMAKRLKSMGVAKYQTDGDPRTSGPGFGVAVHESALTQPLRWRAPRRVFLNSMSDLAHARVADEFLVQVFAVMAVSARHTFQVLTKRPRRLARLLTDPTFAAQVCRVAAATYPTRVAETGWPLPNVWIGTSVESADYSWRIETLRDTPAAVRFLSLEPLLGPLPGLDLTGIGWVIVGGESGPGFRALDMEWVRSIRDQCIHGGVPFFFKQIGGTRPGSGGRDLDGRTWDLYPS